MAGAPPPVLSRQCDGRFAAGAPHLEFAFPFVRSTPERWFEFRW